MLGGLPDTALCMSSKSSLLCIAQDCNEKTTLFQSAPGGTPTANMPSYAATAECQRSSQHLLLAGSKVLNLSRITA